MRVVGSVEEEGEGRKDGPTRNLVASKVTEAAAFKSLLRAQYRGEGDVPLYFR